MAAPPSFPPVFPPPAAPPRPDLPPAPRSPRRRQAGRLRGNVLALLAVALLALGVLELTGLAPWREGPAPAATGAAGDVAGVEDADDDAPEGAGRDEGASGAGPATRLDPALERAISLAVEAAGEAGVPLYISSGLRSAAEQQRLWEEAIEQYGSAEEAARWVLPPEASAHVQGRAVDVGPAEGAAWLAEHGTRWGLCQTYANESWHFERVTEDGGSCPAMLPDASVLLR